VNERFREEVNEDLGPIKWEMMRGFILSVQ